MVRYYILLFVLILAGCNGLRDYGPPGKVIRKETGVVFGTTTYYIVIEPDNGGPTWRFQLSADEYDNWNEGDHLYWKN